MTATDYIRTFHPTCVAYGFSKEKGFAEVQCGKPAVAVYISADHIHEGRYLCAECAEDAEKGGDGPVFWARREDESLEMRALKLGNESGLKHQVDEEGPRGPRSRLAQRKDRE